MIETSQMDNTLLLMPEKLNINGGFCHEHFL